jgi:hypothetical protein
MSEELKRLATDDFDELRLLCGYGIQIASSYKNPTELQRFLELMRQLDAEQLRRTRSGGGALLSGGFMA